MPSEPNAINYLLSGALGAVISGFILLISNYLNNKSQSEREEKQRTWQLEREEKQRIWQLEREEKQHIWQEESERQKWYREKVHDCYLRTIQVLTRVSHEHHETHINSIANVDNTTRLNKETSLTNSIIEFYSQFAMIIADHPEKNTKEFKEKIAKINDYLEKEPWTVQNIFIDIMENDSRIKNISK
jgi:hypothetical protein